MLLFFFIKVVILMMKLKHSICCGLDVHKNVIVATIVTTNKDGISEYKQKSFSTTGLSRIIVIMFVWNPQENTGFLFLIISKTTWKSVLPTPNMSKPSRGRRRTKKIPNGLPTFTNLTWFWQDGNPNHVLSVGT